MQYFNFFKKNNSWKKEKLKLFIQIQRNSIKKLKNQFFKFIMNQKVILEILYSFSI
jgi:hypothetical protein